MKRPVSAVFFVICVACLVIETQVNQASAISFHTSTKARPIALVYRGPAGCDVCSLRMVQMLQASKYNFDVRYVGPSEKLKLTAANLSKAALYAQPGGDPEVDEAYTYMKPYQNIIRQYVQNGGHYLGTCEGMFLAGRTPGFHIFPGDTDDYAGRPGATVHNTDDATVVVRWMGRTRTMYFQDGGIVLLDKGAKATILARYINGDVAATLSRFGKGAVAISGVHPEEHAADYGLNDPDGSDVPQGLQMVNLLMRSTSKP